MDQKDAWLSRSSRLMKHNKMDALKSSVLECLGCAFKFIHENELPRYILHECIMFDAMPTYKCAMFYYIKPMEEIVRIY